MCGSKKAKFIKKQEASEILSSLGIRTPLNKVPVLGDIFFLSECNSPENDKMNYVIYKFLLAGAKFVPEMHL